MNTKLLGIFTAAILGTTALVNPALAKVGIAAAVNGEPRSIPPHDKERILTIGNDIVSDEIVTSRAADRTQIVFQDGSSLTIGPNSQVKVDKFVYDPNSKSGALSLNASRGVFRYIGGAISKNSEVTIKTPSATMGIRGGIVSFTIGSDGTLVANFLFGRSLSVTANGVTVTTTQPGTQIRVRPGQAPNQPEPIPPGLLQEIDHSLQAEPPHDGTQKVEFDGSRIAKYNSDMDPRDAKNNIQSTRDTQLGEVHNNGGVLENAGPLQASGPLQSSGPMQNSGPLAAASPLQMTGPMMGQLPFGEAPMGPGMPNVPYQETTFYPVGTNYSWANISTPQELQTILSTPQGNNSETLVTLVNNFNPGPGYNPPTTSLPPTVYNPSTSTNVSPN